MEIPKARRFLPERSSVSLLLIVIFSVYWTLEALEMNTGKIPYAEVLNGSNVLLPCTYTSCIGITKLYVKWESNINGSIQKIMDSMIPTDNAEPVNKKIYRERVEFVGVPNTNDVSIKIWNVTFEDAGQYTCFGKNPKEKGKNHSAYFTLYVVDELRVVDNTLTLIIVSCVGGCIALLVIFMLLKNFTLFVLAKLEERNKECLVSSGIDNTENGLSGSKTTPKPTPKKA
ncbi:sodium channel, voltage-gated, type IV, beta b [Neoarius graeffei]|uniref:sodium channel, voltage-gated, type IV, beta b n=1 Tax=Neoarius graeffei TaxID=443677 RepID=UPI00298C174B|nr:sodium channel, voltage-gated, type IV, beta b [Neoarius graeffei]